VVYTEGPTYYPSLSKGIKQHITYSLADLVEPIFGFA
jgi:hypothetical protein